MLKLITALLTHKNGFSTLDLVGKDILSFKIVSLKHAMVMVLTSKIENIVKTQKIDAN